MTNCYAPVIRFRPWVTAAALVLFVLAFVSTARCQTDGSAPNVTLRVSLSDFALIDNGDVGQHYPSIPVGQHVTDAVIADGHLDAFRYFYGHGDSGIPACVFTADQVHTDGGPVHLANIGGGRNCGGERGDDRCAYIAEGFTAFAVAGGECSAFNVPDCSGIC